MIKNRKKLINHLRQNGVYISDIWYDAPIAPVKFLKFTDYSDGLCITSEKVSNQIVNFPTHINISVAQAQLLSNKINKWLNIQ